MRKKNKPIKLGRIVFTRIADEYVYIYSGSKKVYVKTMRLSLPGSAGLVRAIMAFHSLLTMKRVLAAVSVSVILIAAGVFFKGGSSVVDDDEVNKMNLLKSVTTDFINPGKENPLEIREYVVKKGETLSKIAAKFGVSMDTICGSNGLTTYEAVPQGTKLKIPTKDGILFKMKKGTRIVEVAKKYNVSLEKILADNNITNADFIAMNSVLFIPDAKPKNIVKGFIWPTSSRFITCGYGWRRNPFDSRFSEFHPGMDIKASYEWVRSSMYGQVTYTGWLGGYGNAVIIAHPGGYKTLYAHLSRIVVKPGQYVKQGQHIARSGNTGRSTGAHLHFEVMKNGAHQNPYRLLMKK